MFSAIVYLKEINNSFVLYRFATLHNHVPWIKVLFFQPLETLTRISRVSLFFGEVVQCTGNCLWSFRFFNWFGCRKRGNYQINLNFRLKEDRRGCSVMVGMLSSYNLWFFLALWWESSGYCRIDLMIFWNW